MMRNINSKQNINGAGAPGRGFSSAPWNICCNTFLTAKKVLDAKSEQSGCSPLAESGADAPQSGRSMIEMLGVLAIIGVLSVGGIAGYSKAMQKYRINKTIEQITLIAGNVRAFWGPQKNYIGVYCSGYTCNATNGCKGSDGGVNSSGYPTSTVNGCPIIKKAKILPDEMITLDSTGKKITAITNPFGGGVVLSENVTNGFTAFGISIAYLPAEACIEIASHDWQAANVVGMYINETLDGDMANVADNDCTAEDDRYFCPAGNTLPLPLEKAVAACSCTEDTCEIILGFK
ncbi:MAG: hypothetical protein IKO06_04530 [Alphaproteobacteria bacterium]|nr:hypothetical protein [Alphaproteobacteria bacterium]